MKNRFSLFIFFLCLMLSFGIVEKVFACSCVPTAPCQQFGRADVSFVGKVVGSKYQKTGNDYRKINEGTDQETYVTEEITYDVGEIYFEVIEAFGGVEKGSRVTIHSRTGGGDCGAWFKRGETYVVFASKEGSKTASGISSLTFGDAGEKLAPDANRLWTTICSGTRELEGADETLKFLRNLPQKGSGGTIVGRIDENIRDYTAENLSYKPMTNAKIQAKNVENEKQIFYGTSNTTGYFEIKVPAGNYLVTPLLESNLTFSNRYEEENEPTKIEDQKCESKIFWALNDSEISGKIVDADGNPIQSLSLELITANANRNAKNFDSKLIFTEDDGSFSLKGVPLGRYQISLNYNDKPDDDSPYPTVFYPNTPLRTKAKIILIDYGTKIKDIVFQLPPKLSKRKISGTVVWKNGKPAVGAEVELNDVDADRNAIFKPAITDAKGEFSIDWFEGRKYKIKVIVWKKSPDGQSGFGIGDAETKIFTLDDKTQKFRIILNANNPDERSIIRRTVRAN